jgi:hypothetical protein
VEVSTFWVQGHGVREFVGAGADPESPQYLDARTRATEMAAMIGGAWATVVVDVPEDAIVDAFAGSWPPMG